MSSTDLNTLTAYIIFGLDGGKATTIGFFIPSMSSMSFCRLRVAVAVKAITFTFPGSKLRTSPIRRKVEQKVLPL